MHKDIDFIIRITAFVELITMNNNGWFKFYINHQGMNTCSQQVVCVCGEGVHIGPTKCESLVPLILFQDGAKVETNSHPKIAPKVAHHPHVLLEILVMCQHHLP